MPNLVVEILSRGTRRRDETLKLQLYERSGVDEYWLVDPERARIRIHRPIEGRFATAIEVCAADGHSLATPLLPDFVVSLSEIFGPGPR